MKSNGFLTIVLLAAVLAVGVMCGALLIERPATAAVGLTGAQPATSGTGGVTSGLFVNLEAAGKIITADAATDEIVGVCELTAAAGAMTRYAPIGTITTITSGSAIAVGDRLTSDSNGKAVPVVETDFNHANVAAIALTADAAGTGSVRAVVVASSVTTQETGSTAVAADALAIPITTAVVLKTTGADAEALTLADGEPGQILVIQLVVDGGGDGTLTPATSTTIGTIVFADAGDVATLMYVDDTRGWTILGLSGLAAQPAYTLPA
jgi:hypothetical protein